MNSKTPQTHRLCFFELKMNQLKYLVRLGNTEEERVVPQTVLFDISLRLPSLPEASETDGITGTFCYGEICSSIDTFLHPEKEFKLIEKLAFEVFHIVRKKIPLSVEIGIKITKEKTPIPHLLGGSSFEIKEYQ